MTDSGIQMLTEVIKEKTQENLYEHINQEGTQTTVTRKHNLSIKTSVGTSLAVQWLRLLALNAGGTGSIPGQGTKIWHFTSRSQRIKLNGGYIDRDLMCVSHTRLCTTVRS